MFTELHFLKNINSLHFCAPNLNWSWYPEKSEKTNKKHKLVSNEPQLPFLARFLSSPCQQRSATSSQTFGVYMVLKIGLICRLPHPTSSQKRKRCFQRGSYSCYVSKSNDGFARNHLFDLAIRTICQFTLQSKSFSQKWEL